MKSRKVIFWKSQKQLTELHGGSLFRTCNSYSFNFNSGLRKRRTCFCLLRTPSPRGAQFLWFFKIDLLRFHCIYLLFDWSKLSGFFFYMCLLRTQLPNLCQNMIHVDALDFSECHSEEVTLSVCNFGYIIQWVARIGHTRVTIGYGGLRQVVASERRKLVRAVFLVTLVRPVYDWYTTHRN